MTIDLNKEVINRICYMYQNIDGSIDFPNSYDGDVLKIAHKASKQSLKLVKQLENEVYTLNQEVLKLKKQVEISKIFFQNILDVKPNIRIGSPSHLANCVHVMKISAENALKRLEEVEND